MSLSKLIKQDARKALDGAWIKGAALLLIVLLPGVLLNLVESVMRKLLDIPFFTDISPESALKFGAGVNLHLVSLMLSLFLSLLLFLLYTPLEQGVYRWYYRRTKGINDSLRDVFFPFEAASTYGKSLWLYLRIYFRTTLWGILFFSPALAVFYFNIFYRKNGAITLSPQMSFLLNTILLLWCLLAAVFTAIRARRYFLAPYMLAEQPKTNVTVLIRRSCRLMRGNAANVFLFELSFITWLLPLAIALVFYYCFNAPGLWMAAGLLLVLQFIILLMLYPYMEMSRALYARYILDAQRRYEDRENATKEFSQSSAPDTVQAPDLPHFKQL